MKRPLTPRFALWLCALALQAGTAAAQEIRYITDNHYVPLRSGQGTQYRIVHRGLPTGTRLTVTESNEESGYSLVATDNGTEGWILTRYLSGQMPASDRLAALQTKYDALLGDEGSLRSQLVEVQRQLGDATDRASGLDRVLEETRTELDDLKRLSGNALNLDITNRRLTEESEVMRTRIEVLEAENLRLKESRSSQAFVNGALAVLAGVIIALIAQRLRPRPRSSSSWA
ncbi:MAG: TIGR04211 family SH3 domain-containing protein [Halieaceae bacterium]|nr:TIGR04211 family SH3 domain-containing protein [Halieaceae bacterium]